MRQIWLQTETPEIFISASDLALDVCSSLSGGGVTAAGVAGPFHQASFLLEFHIIASQRYVSRAVSLLVSHGI